MPDWRTLALGAVAFCATFVGGWWIGLGSSVDVSGAVAVQQFVTGAAEALWPVPSTPAAATPFQGKALTDDDRLRQAVVLRAKAYEKPYCNQDPKTLYIKAATNYAETLMRSAGCSNFPKCPMSMEQLDQVWRLNRSPLDRPVAEAMGAVNSAGGLLDKDFRGDVGRAVRVIAGSDFRSGPGPACLSSNTRSSWWIRRIRIRR